MDPNVERVPLSILKRRRGELRLRAFEDLEALKFRVEGLRCVDVSSIELWDISALESELQIVEVRCEDYGDAHIEIQCVDETSVYEDDRVICEFQSGLLLLEHEIRTIHFRRDVLVLNQTPCRVRTLLIVSKHQPDDVRNKSLLVNKAPLRVVESLGEVELSVVCLSWSLVGVGGSISSSSSSSSDRDFFDDDSNDMFDQMEKEDRFHEALDEGFDTWEERCLKIGGQAVLDDWLQAQENLVYCVMRNFDMAKIQRQMDMSGKNKNLDLDVVFKEHCGEPVAKTRPCIEDFLEVSRGCIGQDEDRNSLNITMHMIDAAVDFVCYNNGGRLALFMSESGMDCMKTHQDGIMKCVDSKAPELFHKRSKSNINTILFDAQNCRKGDMVRECIEKELLKCDDPTPSNVVNSMMLAMKDVTPCKQISSRYAASKAPSRYFSQGILATFQPFWLSLVAIMGKTLLS